MKITTLKTVSTLMLLLNWIIASIAAAAEDCELVLNLLPEVMDFYRNRCLNKPIPQMRL